MAAGMRAIFAQEFGLANTLGRTVLLVITLIKEQISTDNYRKPGKRKRVKNNFYPLLATIDYFKLAFLIFQSIFLTNRQMPDRDGLHPCTFRGQCHV